MTFKALRRLSVVAIVFNVAFAFVALFWLTMRLRAYISERPPWPLWQDFDIVAPTILGVVSVYTFAVMWTYLRKTRRGPEVEALQARGRREVLDLETAVQKAELQKRLRDLTRPQ